MGFLKKIDWTKIIVGLIVLGTIAVMIICRRVKKEHMTISDSEFLMTFVLCDKTKMLLREFITHNPMYGKHIYQSNLSQLLLPLCKEKKLHQAISQDIMNYLDNKKEVQNKIIDKVDNKMNKLNKKDLKKIEKKISEIQKIIEKFGVDSRDLMYYLSQIPDSIYEEMVTENRPLLSSFPGLYN